MSNTRGPFLGDGQIVTSGSDLSKRDNIIPVMIFVGMDENTEMNQITVRTPIDWHGSREYIWTMQLPDPTSIEVIARCVETMSPITRSQLESLGFVEWSCDETGN